MPDIIKDLDAKLEAFKQYENTSERYNDWQTKLYVPQTNFDNLDELRTQLTSRHLMWHSLDEWNTLTADWLQSQFGQIDAPSIAKQAEKYAKICKRLEGAIDPNPIQQKLKNLVEQFEAAMPIVMALRNPDLQDMHWNDIRELIGQDLNIHEEGFTLQSLIDMNVVQYMEQIVAKSVEATGQAKLRGQLQDLIEIWKGVQFATKNYKEKDNQFILVDIDTMYQYLDEGLAAINMILGNRFVKVMRPEAEKVKKELNILAEAVDQWVEVQRQWCYLENIFNGGTIKSYLPEESKLFDQVNKVFLALNLKANRTP
jgi:dynein heavy chain